MFILINLFYIIISCHSTIHIVFKIPLSLITFLNWQNKKRITNHFFFGKFFKKRSGYNCSAINFLWCLTVKKLKYHINQGGKTANEKHFPCKFKYGFQSKMKTFDKFKLGPFLSFLSTSSRSITGPAHKGQCLPCSCH